MEGSEKGPWKAVHKGSGRAAEEGDRCAHTAPEPRCRSRTAATVRRSSGRMSSAAAA